MAMFPPQLPHYFISRFTADGDTVLDPFCGRGTTPVQAAALGRVGIGNDLNDLAYVLTRGKLANPSLEAVLARLTILEDEFNRDEWMRFSGVPHKIRMIFHPETMRQLLHLRRGLDWRSDDIDSFVTMVLMGAMHGASSGFLSIPMPNTFSMGWKYVRKYIDENGLERPVRDVFHVLRTRVHRILGKGQLRGTGRAIHGDARDLQALGRVTPGSVDLLFSSPPYLKVIKYGLYNWIRLWWLIGDHQEIDRKLDDEHAIVPYLKFMTEILETTLPLLNPDTGLACWVIGDVGDIRTAERVWASAASKVRVRDSRGHLAGYRLLQIVEDEIRDVEKVTRIWNSSTDKSGKATPIDRILLICHEDADPVIHADHDQVSYDRFTGA